MENTTNLGSKKSKRQNRFRLLYIIGTILVIFLIGIFNHDVETLKEVLPRINMRWIWISIISVVLFWLSDALLLGQITRYIFEPQKFSKSLRVGIMGLYYGALTPFASGGQPMQVVYMKRDGVPYGTSTSIVTVKFIVFELSLCLLYLGAIIVRGSFFFANYPHVFWLTTAGFIMNLVAVVFITIIMFNRKVAGNIVHGIIHFLSKIKIIRKTEERTIYVDNLIDEFYLSSAYIKKNLLNFVFSVVISVLNMSFLFAVPYFIYRAFGLSAEPFILMFTLQAFLYLAVSLVPLPGAAGASEGGFYLFFSTFFVSIPVFMPMLIWRFFTYYLILLLGSIWVVGDELRQIIKSHRETKKKDKNSVENH